MTITRVGAILSAALLLSCSGTIAASAAAPSAVPGLSPGQVQDILTVNPGLTETQLIDDARHYAQRSGTSIEQVLAAAAIDAHTVVAAPQARSSGGGSNILAPGRDDGDMWYEEGVPGHVGIYTPGNNIVEAPGTGFLSHETWFRNVTVPDGSHQITTVKSAEVQAVAARYASAHLVGLPYNLAFWNNKGTHHPRSVNCSQLVWIAYDASIALDLDYNGGLGVYPWDIYRSDYTVEY